MMLQNITSVQEQQESKQINIALVDESKLFRESFKLLLQDDVEINMIADASSFKELDQLSTQSKDKLDILIVEIGDNPIYVINSIKRYLIERPELKVIALTYQKEESYVLPVIKAGVKGYLCKEMDLSSTIHAIKDIYEGKVYLHPDVLGYVINDYQSFFTENNKESKHDTIQPNLSRREQEVLELLLDGRTNNEIAEVLSVKEVTVKNHVYNLMKKMNVEHRTEAVLKAIQKGWVVI
ncbi:response regulator transcription factor [Cerasibacillus terrae]|uniref:Response regulator transcription factor n=2 Tax=Cerasibacillus terrae TaxID=2498845 RepID=A0A5C8NII8_9BACI|nr:response regulator transcription factor [Cerasibacillus terrae]